MRILHVLHSLDPVSGGPYVALREMVREQVRRGLKVEILATTAQFTSRPLGPEALEKRIASDPAFEGIELHLLKAIGRRGPLLHFGYCPRLRSWAHDRFSDGADPPTAIHIHGVFSHLCLAVPRLAEKFDTPYIVRPAGILNVASLQSGLSPLKRLLFSLRVRRNLQRAASVQATSTREADELRRLAKLANVSVVPHGVELPEEAALQRGKEEFLERFPVLREKRIILFMSRLAPKKRLDLLVYAFARASEADARLHLVLAGSDHGSESMTRKLIAELGLESRAHFVGFLQGDAKTGALASASLLALTSEDENFGVIVPEAMAHGTSVLVTEGVDSHVFVDEAKSGLTVSCDKRGVEEGLGQLLAGDLAGMGERGRDFARMHLGWDAVCSELEKLYRSSPNA